MRMAAIVILRGPATGHHFSLFGECTTLGRAPDCSICLDGNKVSPYHAQILHKNNEYNLQDMGSSNGTVFNGKRLLPLTPTVFTEADTCRIATYLVALRAPRPFSPLLDTLLEHLMTLFPRADRFIVISRENEKLVVRAQRTRIGSGLSSILFSGTAVSRCLDAGMGFISDELSGNLPENGKNHSTVCVPFTYRSGKPGGVIQANRIGPGFSTNDLDYLTALSVQVAGVLELSELRACPSAGEAGWESAQTDPINPKSAPIVPAASEPALTRSATRAESEREPDTGWGQESPPVPATAQLVGTAAEVWPCGSPPQSVPLYVDCDVGRIFLVEAETAEREAPVAQPLGTPTTGQRAGDDAGPGGTPGSSSNPNGTGPRWGNWAIGLETGNKWHLFYQFHGTWRHHGVVRGISKGRRANLMRAFAEGGGFLSKAIALRLERFVYSVSDIDKLMGRITPELTKLRNAIRVAVGAKNIKADPLPFVDDPPGWRAQISIGYAVQDDRDCVGGERRLRFKTRDHLTASESADR
jgi:hypothetical protein